VIVDFFARFDFYKLAEVIGKYYHGKQKASLTSWLFNMRLC